MTVRVHFHQQASGPQSDPRKVVPVSQTVPRSPRVAAAAALNEPLRGPTDRERAAGYWSFFSDDTCPRPTGTTAGPRRRADPATSRQRAATARPAERHGDRGPLAPAPALPAPATVSSAAFR
jgi:hypothetical protein